MLRALRTHFASVLPVILLASFALFSGGELAAQVTQGSPVPLGLNLDLNEQSLVESAVRLGAIDGSNTPITADSNGNPASDFEIVLDNRYIFAWVPGAPNIDPLKYSTDISGVYTLSFTGQATLGAISGVSVTNKVYHPDTNTTTANVTMQNWAGGVFVELQFRSTRRLPTDPANAANGVTNLHLQKPAALWTQSPVFTDLWLHSITDYGWSALRFMGVLGTNDYADPASAEAYPYRLQWATDRNLPSAGALYGLTHTGIHGIPWEYVILAANAVNRDIWVNIPVNASDDYVNQLATLLKNGNAATGNQGVNPGINLYLEYSNEMWHDGFYQGPWNRQAATDEVNAGGSNLKYDGNTSADIWRQRRIAKRTVEIGKAFRAVFADSPPSRFRPVINDANLFDPRNLLQYVNDVYGAPADYLYAVALTGYYGSTNKSSVDTIISGEMASSDTNRTGYLAYRAINTFYGLHSLVYEGGQDEEGNKSPTSPVDTYLANQFAAARDPRMAQVETHDLLGNWYTAGGDLYMQFGHAGRYSTYGMWGLSDDLTNQTSGKWQGVKTIMTTPAPKVTAGTAVSSTVQTLITTGASVYNPSSSPIYVHSGTALYWLLNVPTAGIYLLSSDVTYSSGGGIAQIWVNNRRQPQNLTVNASGGSSVITTAAVPVALNQGLNTLRQTVTQSGWETVRLRLTPGNAVTGTVTLEGVPDLSSTAVPVAPLTLTLLPTDGSAALAVTTRLTPAAAPTGTFTVLTAAKPYHLQIKGANTLTAGVSFDAVGGSVSGLTATLRAGDATNNDIVDFDDFLLLLNSFGSKANDAASFYDDRADFNRDGMIDFDDFLLLLNNFGLHGDL